MTKKELQEVICKLEELIADLKIKLGLADVAILPDGPPDPGVK